MSRIRITVPEPCHESRNGNITRLDAQHLHCSTCARTLTDFSQMSDTELALWFRQANGKLCGRFAPGQLDRLISVPAEKPKPKYWLNAIWLLPLSFFAKPAQGQTTTPHVILEKPPRCVPVAGVQKECVMSATPKTDTIRGTVQDLDIGNQPLKGATVQLVRVKDGKIVEKQSANAKGEFAFVLKEKAEPGAYKITASHPGYESAQQIITTPEKALVIGLMNYSMMVDGLIVIDRD